MNIEKQTVLGSLSDELNDEMKKYKAIIEYSYDWEYLMNTDGSFFYMSPSVERITGYKPDEFIKKPELLLKIILPEDRKLWENHYRYVRDNLVSEEIQFRVLTRNGQIRWIEHACCPVIDENKKSLGIRVTNREITERKKNEEELQKYRDHLEILVKERTEELDRSNKILQVEVSERKAKEEQVFEQFKFLEVLLNAIPNPVFYKGLNGKYLGCNKAFEEYYGLPKKEIIGKTVFDMGPKEIADKYFEKDEELFKNPGEQIYEWKVKNKEGKEKDVIFNKATFNDVKGKTAGLIGVINDITERKNMENQIRKSLNEKEVLLREIHHRVKNNMQIVSSLLHLQSQSIENEELKAVFDESQNRIKAMALIHEKLYNTKNIAQIDLGIYIKDLAGNLQRTLSKNSISYNVEVYDINLDIEKIIPCALIINELITNSIKYAFPKGENGLINITCKRYDDDNAVLTFSDNGIGFPETIDYTKTESLGLRLVNSLIDQLGGTIELIRDNGTTFVLKFKVSNL